MSLMTQLKEKLGNYLLSDTSKMAMYDGSYVRTSHLHHLSNSQKVLKIANFIAHHHKLGIALLSYLHGDIKKAEQKMQKSYQGIFKNTLEFTYQHIKKIDPAPCYLEAYIDYERFTKDLFIDEFFALEVEGKTHVFKGED
jgi:antirestriction protein